MRAQQRMSRLLAAVLALCLIGCESTKLTTTWKDPTATTLSFDKVVVVVLNSSPAERRAQEDALVASIKRTKALPSYPIIPDDLLKDVPQVKKRIIEGGFDGAVVLRLVDTRQETTYVPPSASSTWDGGDGGGWGWGYNSYPSHPSYHVSPGYTVSDTFVRAEITLYAVPSGKLLWSGASETTNPANARAFATDVVKAAAVELRKQGLLR